MQASLPQKVDALVTAFIAWNIERETSPEEDANLTTSLTTKMKELGEYMTGEYHGYMTVLTHLVENKGNLQRVEKNVITIGRMIILAMSKIPDVIDGVGKKLKTIDDWEPQDVELLEAAEAFQKFTQEIFDQIEKM